MNMIIYINELNDSNFEPKEHRKTTFGTVKQLLVKF